MKLSYLPLLLCLVFINPSCSIEKRLYTKGWNIQSNKNYSFHQEKKQVDSLSVAKIDSTDQSKEVNTLLPKRVKPFPFLENLRQVSIVRQEIKDQVASIQMDEESPIKSFKRIVKGHKELNQQLLENEEPKKKNLTWLWVLFIAVGMAIQALILTLFITSQKSGQAYFNLPWIVKFFGGALIFVIGIALCITGWTALVIIAFHR